MIAAQLDVGGVTWQRESDVVIVGAGAAGLSAALRLIGAGRRVVLVTKGWLGDGSTAWAQGGPADAPTGSIAADALAPRRVGELVYPITRAYVSEVRHSV